MKNLNYFWRDAKLVLLGFCCSIAILIMGACSGIEVDANEVAGVLSVTAYLLTIIYPYKRKSVETMFMPMVVASLALVLGLGWWVWLLVLALIVFHLYYIEMSRGFVLVLYISAIVIMSLVCCGASHLVYWLISLF